MADEKEVKKFESELIWEEIKDLSIDMFGLPNQKISQYVTPINKIAGSKLYVKISVSSVITSLENAISHKFDVNQGDAYITIERKAAQPVEISDVLPNRSKKTK